MLTQFRPGLYLPEVPLDGAVTVRGALILGDSRAVVWDTLTRPVDMQPLLPLIGELPLTVVYSHADWDHVWGTAALPYEEIIGHSLCAARFEADVPEQLHEHRTARPGWYDEVLLLSPTRTFDDSLTLDIGGVTLELHHLPGHTPDCIVAWLPEWGMLLAGDTVETPLPYVNHAHLLHDWIAGLEVCANDERVQTVIPCHGAISDRGLLWRNIAYLRGLPDGSSLLPADLDEAYREVHTANLATVRGGR
ncbi:MAG: MBL fold metallo-hydrolase [Chloroflexaceae bacterium]|jgi:glyoxylase-like metal-dependent hydrolase (beta-lactamase superfamily II)|nr:MBL fold metallo-hydrolase [Chloroflexaceae bacterium]